MLIGDSTGIPDAHVLNLSKGTGTVSSRDGSFALNVRGSDTIKFSCIGFQDHFLSVSLLMLRKELMVFLKQDTILMDELLIHPLGPRRFFKYRFMELELPKREELTLNLHLFGIKNDPAYVPPTTLTFTGPVQLLYDAFNKSARLSRKLRKNRKTYSGYLKPVKGDSLVYPEGPD